MLSSAKSDRVDALIETLGTDLDYTEAARSFSPFYSDIGLGFSDKPGIAHLYFHYNRRTIPLSAQLLAVEGAVTGQAHGPLAVEQSMPSGTFRCAFYERNSWVVEIHGAPGAELRVAHEGLRELRVRTAATRNGARAHVFEGYLPTGDSRDPDRQVPFLLGIVVRQGTARVGKPIGGMTLTPDSKGAMVLAFTAWALEVDRVRAVEMLQGAPSYDDARSRSRIWLQTALGNLDCRDDEPAAARALARAAYTLASNASRAPGRLAGMVSAFPSRGRYPTHYLWDSCFQNLALEYMDPRLAADALLLLTENLRADGKMPQFVCSTWDRPAESQPALVGWAGWRLVQQRNDRDLSQRLLNPLLKNTEWWLTHRMTNSGILYCPHPLETGWDNTPRFDRGPVLAADMNSYVLMQMRACVKLAHFAGEDAVARETEARASDFAEDLVRVLYDADANIFNDVLVETGERLSIKTPACFLPLLAGVPLDKQRSCSMIGTYLLNPKLFFGTVPFPSVAYDEAEYRSDNWWRGPTWMPVAYLMLALLRRFGYEKEWRVAARRLYDVIVADGNIRELFDSQTGAGRGAHQQGWTAAVLLRLHIELQETVSQ